MKKNIVTITETQNHIDFIIKMSSIDLAEFSREEKEIHIDVDTILAEPITSLKPISHYKKKEVAPNQRRSHAENKALKRHLDSRLHIPNRERLIVHPHESTGKKQDTLKTLLGSLLSSLIYTE